MKTIYTDNEALLDLLEEKGVRIYCNENMEMILTDDDAERVPAIVAEFAPAAINDYTIE